MAIDTKEKRASVLGVGRPWMRDKFPVATLTEAWRIASGNAYGGNSIIFIPPPLLSHRTRKPRSQGRGIIVPPRTKTSKVAV